MAYDALVLAAGAGRRYGGVKQLADWRGRPLICSAVASALAADVDRVTVVLGAEATAVAAALSPLDGDRLRIVVASNWAEGIAASLRAGLSSLPANSEGVLIFLGDMPAIPPGLPPRVLRALAAGAMAVKPAASGAPAHPVGVSATLYPALLELKGDAGAGALLLRRADVVTLDAGGSGAALDIDTPNDLARAVNTNPASGTFSAPAAYRLDQGKCS